ncbi:SDR family oxidoreductase [Rhizobium leguminosarum]|uniref:SDR family oxidoreductase n=1 Tax=Rhizobium leguminosarum TaxID=384 RepID=UPI003ECEF9F8
MSCATLLVSGGSGAIGNSFLMDFLEREPLVDVVCIARSPRARACIAGTINCNTRVRIIDCDLLSDLSVNLAARDIGKIGKIVAVHCAADVSWDKSAAALYNLNVLGTARFCGLIQQVSSASRLIYVSTAFTKREGRDVRNGYEETKAVAESTLESKGIPYSVFSPSLVVGDSRTGHISRFNGIYPILRFLTEFAPPFLVGNKNGFLDIVPIDWVVSQLYELVSEQLRGETPRHIVASAGAAGRIGFERAIRIAEAEINKERFATGLGLAAAVPVIKLRQWEFLKRSLEVWRPPNLGLRDFRYFERLLNVYASYSEDNRARAPEGTSTSAPDPERYMPTVIQYWLTKSARRLGPATAAGGPQ